MKLYKPFLKRRSDGSEPKKNRFFGTLDSVFNIYNENISFHFFSGESGLKHKKAWKILLNEFDTFDDVNVAQEIIRVETREKVESNIYFLDQFEIELEYIIFYDRINWEIDNGQIYKVK